KCLVISKYGAHMIHQCVSSAIELTEDSTFATTFDLPDLEARWTTDSLDFGSIGLKSLEALLAHVSCPASTNLWLSPNWRVRKAAAFVSGQQRPAGPIGRSVIAIAALNFQLRGRFSNYTSVELFELLANVKFSDQRFKRGTVPAQFSA